MERWPAVYDRVRRYTPGMYTRTAGWWEHRILREMDQAPPGFTAPLLVQYEDGGEPAGYVKYRRKMDSLHGAPAGTIRVSELMAATDAAYAGLWRFVFGVDLVVDIEAGLRPVDEPLFWMLEDPRRLVREPSDALWLRIVDVPSVLAARSYAVEGRLLIEVRNEFCPWTAGTYELTGGPAGAQCRPTSDPADLSLGIADLGAVYLGGARLQALRRAGRVAGDAASLQLADAMFASDRMPWCPEVF